MLASFGFDDTDLARRLQEEYDREAAAQLAAQTDSDSPFLSTEDESISSAGNRSGFSSSRSPLILGISPVDPSLEVSDPNPDIRELFLQFNDQFFWGRLSGIEVKWSPRMTLCAGLCVYEGHGGLCSVRLSLPLLKLRPRKDLVETLLHEMIHAYLFVTDNEKDHDDHGPNFKKHMYRINKDTGANISIYHTFHDEVASYQQHWWKCDGPCQKRPPYYGMVKRAMNRAPSHRDPWFNDHQRTCGGTFIKIKEPEGYGQKKTGKGKAGEKLDKGPGNTTDIRTFVGKGVILGSSSNEGKSSATNDITGGSGTRKGEANTRTDKGLAVITNGVLTHRKTTGLLDKNRDLSKPPGKTSSPLFSSVSSTSASWTSKAGGPATNSKPSSGSFFKGSVSGTSKGSSSIGSFSGHSSRKNVSKGKGNFNDNITLLELFKQRQARSKGISNSNERKSVMNDRREDESCIERKSNQEKEVREVEQCSDKKGLLSNDMRQMKRESGEGFCNNDDDDFVVDLTGSNDIDYDEKTNTPTVKKDNHPVFYPKKDSRTRWKNIFPSMSGKKNKDKSKGSLKSRFPKNFVSVCEGGDYGNARLKTGEKKSRDEKQRRKYILDELDSNDDLWDEGKPSGTSSENGDNGNMNDSSDQDKSESENAHTSSDNEPKHEDLKFTTKPIVSEHDKTFETTMAGPSSSQAHGHVLGTGETGLSFLAQVRRKLRDEQKRKQSDSESGSSHERHSPNVTVKGASSKRSSDAAFGHRDDLPTAKRHNAEQAGDSGEPANGKVACPVCTQLVLEADINDHLDRCLL
ncbi:sprt-like domain-containing protein spartan [Plakobranchus ocellatus]|uniref:Protein with SprT-like domain at the N terminus n=1 Tax=Plakobranchus ocellatus TaxID=259542 RepID=A0AAV4B9Y1_9GAST|nr:sprt-like domain-containing protein spartan [Plakobranchus ocellatus]